MSFSFTFLGTQRLVKLSGPQGEAAVLFYGQLFLSLEIYSLLPEGRALEDNIACKIRHYLKMKKLQPEDKIIKVDKELGIAWILLPPDAALGGFQGISPRIIDEEKFISAKKKSEEE